MTGRVYRLLPAVHRIRDAERGEPLRALLSVMEEELEALRADVEGLQRDWFAETCSEDVVPYLGALVGVRGLGPQVEGMPSRRALVANAIAWRRRKGTAAMLEELARGVTGWSARAVESFDQLGWTQHADHVRATPAAEAPRSPPSHDRVGTLNLRSMDVVDRLGGPFDVASRTVDVRAPAQAEGWHNVPNVVLFLHRLQAYPLRKATPRPAEACAHGFHLDPLGRPAPVFHAGATETLGPERVEERHLCAPIRPLAFHRDLRAHEDETKAGAGAAPAEDTLYYGPGRDLLLYRRDRPEDDFDPIPAGRIVCKDLSDWGEPEPGKVALDVRLGRVTFPAAEVPLELRATWCYGFAGDVGGGPYDRDQPPVPGRADEVTVSRTGPAHHATLAAALATCKPNVTTVVRILDSAAYAEHLDVDLPNDARLVVEAAPGQRPVLRPSVLAEGRPRPVRWILRGGMRTLVDLRGLVVEGEGIRLEGQIERLRLSHCTLVPGLALLERPDARAPLHGAVPSITSAISAPKTPKPPRPKAKKGEPAPPPPPPPKPAEKPPRAIEIERSIVGPIHVPSTLHTLRVKDSVVDAPPILPGRITRAMRLGEEDLPPPLGPATRVAVAGEDGRRVGPRATFERCTVFGQVRVRELALASECIFTGKVEARHRQEGCVRFSWLPEGSDTPRRHRCQPDLALAHPGKEGKTALRRRLVPSFASTVYGDPSYAQLSLHCPDEVRTGAEDGGEMGVFCHLKDPLREAELRRRLDEFLPFGLQAGLVYVT